MRSWLKYMIRMGDNGLQDRKRESLVKAAKRIRAIKTEGPMDLAQKMDEYLYVAV